MSTTIDSLQIEIQSSSTNAAQGIEALATSLEKLKKNGSFKTVSNNLNHLSSSLKNLPNVHQASNSLRTLANSIERLKEVGSISSLSNSIAKLPAALKSLGNINIEKLKPQIDGVANAVSGLSSIKAGGLGTMVNAMKNLGTLDFGEITKNLEGDSINNFISKVQLLNEKLGPLSEKMTNIKAGFNAINTGARKAASGVRELDTGIDISALNMSSFIDVIRTAADALHNFIVKFTDITHDAMQWDGIKYQFGNAFGEQADIYYDKITEITEALNINKQSFMEHSAMFSSMLIGFGVDRKDAREMGLGYTELAYDIWAAFNNVYTKLEGADGAMAAVRSAIAGEVEPIRRAGFTIVEATLEQTAANHGLEISLANATEAQKSYLRYLELVDQAQRKGIVGTYAREMETAEGMMRTFAQQTKSLSQAFGSLFLPILVKVMPYVQAFVELLEDGIRYIAGLLGIKIQDIGGTWNDYSSGVTDAVENTENVTGALNDATKAAKELKNATLGIDELNVISPSSASGASGSGAGSGSGGSGGSGFDGLDIESLWDQSIFDGIQNNVNELKKKLKGIFDDWLPTIEIIGAALGAWSIANLLNNLGTALELGDKFHSKVTNIKKLAATAVIIAVQFKLMENAFGDFMGEDGSIKDYLEAVFVGALSAYGAKALWGTTGLIISLAVTAVASFSAVLENGGIKDVESLTVALTGLATGTVALSLAWKALSGSKFIGELGAFIALAKEGGTINALSAAFPKLSTAISGIIPSLTGALGAVKSFIPNILSGIGSMFSSIATAIMAHPLVAIAVAVVAALVGAIVLAIVDYDFTEIGYKFGQAIGNTLKAVVDFGKMIWDRIQAGIDWVVDTFGGLSWSEFWAKFLEVGKNCVSGIWEGIKAGWANLKSNIKEFVDGFLKGFKDALGIHSPSTAFAKIGQYCIDGLKSTLSVDAIKEKLSSMWSKAKSWWDSSKSALKSYTPSIGSIYDKLKERWDNARTWWNDKKTKAKEYTPSIGSIYEKLYDRWKNARDWWNNKKGSMSYTPSIGSIVDKVKSAWNTAKSWWNKNVSLSTKLDVKVPKITVKWDTASAFGKSFKYPTGFSLKFAANGGIFDQGSLIWAGERGPEVMATAAGGKTGVMNVQQMQEAVYEGVYSAVSAAMRGMGGSGTQAVNVYLDGKQITAAVEQRQNERGASIMGNEVYSY